MDELHPFWSGFLGELRKEAFVDKAVQFAQEHPVIAGGVAAGGLAAGLGGVALARKMGIPGTHKPPVPAAGMSWKHVGLAGVGGAALGAYLMKKHKDKQQQ